MNLDFSRLRSEFATWCVDNQYFATSSIFSLAVIELTDKFPSLAGVVVKEGKIRILLNPAMLELYEVSKKAAFFILVHEIRHIVQCVDYVDSIDSTDVTPILVVIQDKMAAATTPEAKEGWKNLQKTWTIKKTKRKALSHIVNMSMDAALHEHLVKMLPKEMATINSFLADVFVPAKKPYKTDLDQVLANVESATIGPKLKATIAKIQQLNISDEEKAVKIQKSMVGTVTVESLEDHFNSLEGYAPTLNRESEWSYYVDQGVLFIAEQLKREEPNNPPEPSEDSEPTYLDQHDIDEMSEEDQAEMREQMKKATSDVKRKAHEAGTQAADMEFLPDSSLSINAALKQVLNKIKIKFTHLLKESNDTSYTYSAINKLYSECDYLPGTKTLQKPHPSIVLVVDTSGSMWSDSILNQLSAAAREFSAKGQLAKMFCCDTELHEIPLHHIKQIKLIGGGGTVFDHELAMEIVGRCKTKKKVDIVYITDEAVLGLKSTRGQKEYKVHVINIEKLLR